MKLRIGLICLLLSASLQGHDSPVANPSRYRATRGCGAFCVAVAAGRSGAVGVTSRAAAEATDPDGDGSCSLREIAASLGEFGIEAVALRSLDQTLPSGLSILHVRSSPWISEPDHFIVAEASTPGKHRFFLPNVGSGIEDDERVLSLWEGNYVLVKRPHAGMNVWVILLSVLGSIAVGATLSCALSGRWARSGGAQ
ncbi:MAG TPA: hypothetical protein EYQ25_01320 [Planctomycetes bacterium]|nr:hypothetical protein [Planctomycetota bacterium]HIL38415.1 hypothetical protein [Planctomycetota bacterium]